MQAALKPIKETVVFILTGRYFSSIFIYFEQGALGD